MAVVLLTEYACGQRRRRRRYWVHPILTNRPSMGEFHMLYGQLRDHPEKFSSYFRMCIASFDELLALVSDTVQHDDTNYRVSISPIERLVVTLRFLSTGASYTALHYEFRIGKSTISTFVPETCKAMWNILVPIFMVMPNKDKWLEIADMFWDRTKFPNCLGAIDGKHIRIVMPPTSGSIFFNYKKYFSLVLMAVTDANYHFVAIDVGSYGSAADSTVFQSSVFNQRLTQGQLDIPEPRPLPGTTEPLIPMVFVADEAFGISNNLMRPYSSRSLNPIRTNFNFRLSRARRMVECTFGILANKWRVLHTPICLDVENVVEVVKATCILHNFVRIREGCHVENTQTHNFSVLQGPRLRGPNSAFHIRDKLANYFLSTEGRFPH
ncbi:uncharacterized protein ACMZJ9_001121 [Mantella aurantiaca]